MKTLLIVLTCLLFFSSLSFSQDVDIPQWVQKLIQQYEQQPVANPPLSVSRCEYRGDLVYYVPPRCCDIASELFNEEGERICSPDGGYAGDGDGQCSDFFVEKKDCTILWQDSRVENMSGSKK